MSRPDREYDDPATAAANVLRTFGFDDQEIGGRLLVDPGDGVGPAEAITEADDRGHDFFASLRDDEELRAALDAAMDERPDLLERLERSPVTPDALAEVQSFVLERTGRRLDGYAHDAVSTAFRRSPRVGTIDWKYRATTPAHVFSDLLEPHGYRIEFRDLDGDPLERLVRNDHPEAFRVVWVDAVTGREESTAFRYPPTKLGANELSALVCAVQSEFLDPRGFELVRLADVGDAEEYALFDREELTDLRETFGADLTAFGEPLLDPRSPLEAALRRYDPDRRIDHESEYGRPEPADSFAVERTEAGRAVLQERGIDPPGE